MKTVLRFDHLNKADIEVMDTGDGFTVICGDYIANVWEENYPTLSLALLRVAVLVKCGESGFEKMFANNSEVFAGVGEVFLNSEVVA